MEKIGTTISIPQNYKDEFPKVKFSVEGYSKSPFTGYYVGIGTKESNFEELVSCHIFITAEGRVMTPEFAITSNIIIE